MAPGQFSPRDDGDSASLHFRDNRGAVVPMPVAVNLPSQEVRTQTSAARHGPGFRSRMVPLLGSEPGITTLSSNRGRPILRRIGGVSSPWFRQFTSIIPLWGHQAWWFSLLVSWTPLQDPKEPEKSATLFNIAGILA